MAPNVLDLVDLARYPIDDPSSEGFAAVVAAGQRGIAEVGYAELPGFIAPRALGALEAEADHLSSVAFASGGVGTAYLELPDEEAFDEAHPRRWWMPYGVNVVSYDLHPLESMLRALYEADELLRLIEAILGRGELFRYADPFGALNLAVMGDGDELQWHFDQTDFVVSLAVRDAEIGGDFEVVPKIRSGEDEHYDEVDAVLHGSTAGVVHVEMTPGTLLIFEGRNSLHRVSPIHGDTTRLVSLLAYDTEPDRVGSELLRAIRYGRTTPFDVPPALGATS
jgi:hypothetical protein